MAFSVHKDAFLCLPALLSFSISLTLLLTDPNALQPCYWAASCKQELYIDPSGNHLLSGPCPAPASYPSTIFFSHVSMLKSSPKKKEDEILVGMTAGYVPCSSWDWHTGPLCGCVEGGPFPPLLLIHTLEAPIQPESGWGEVGALL